MLYHDLRIYSQGERDWHDESAARFTHKTSYHHLGEIGTLFPTFLHNTDCNALDGLYCAWSSSVFKHLQCRDGIADLYRVVAINWVDGIYNRQHSVDRLDCVGGDVYASSNHAFWDDFPD